MGITQETRRESYEQINPTARYALILGVLRGKQMTAREIAYKLGFSDLNAVKPRLTELHQRGRVKVSGKRVDDVTKKKVAVYEVVDSA